jgi:hypothetical protein
MRVARIKWCRGSDDSSPATIAPGTQRLINGGSYRFNIPMPWAVYDSVALLVEEGEASEKE